VEDKMTADEIKKALEEMGIPVNQWKKTNTGTVKSPILEKQKEALNQMKSLLEIQLERDQQTLSHLHVALQKAKHGGGGQ
jgi:hypothetical protein